jgi:integrase/recombinase XerD
MSNSRILETLNRRSWILESPLEQIIDQFIEYLISQKYSANTIRGYVKAIAHFAHWCTKKKISLANIDCLVCSRFIKTHLPTCSCPQPRKCDVVTNKSALAHLQAVLELHCYASSSSQQSSFISDEVDEFQIYLERTCGLAFNTILSRIKIVQAFLQKTFSKEINLSRIRVADVDNFVGLYALRWSSASLNSVRGALRSYFRYRSLKGDQQAGKLTLLLPVIANWKQATVPKFLTDEQVSRVFDSFDRSPIGLRDRAIARCLLDLGLRGHEVSQLTLESLDWRKGIIMIENSKGRLKKELPLPWQTGKAIAAYLKTARPKAATRSLFLRQEAPLEKPLSTAGIRGAMRRAFSRCGLSDKFCNTHIFRHTLAVNLQKSGASLKEIADVLRHQELESTAIYAKVNLSALNAVTLPWLER